MQKLDRSGSGSGIAGPLGTPAVNSTGVSLPTAPLLGAASPLDLVLLFPTATLPSIDTVGVPSECLLLKNMSNPAVEIGGGFF
ncbi:hypothetical protein CerSpe_196590 [Prunus speciosa]